MVYQNCFLDVGQEEKPQYEWQTHIERKLLLRRLENFVHARVVIGKGLWRLKAVKIASLE
jgi:hypothetical protein